MITTLISFLLFIISSFISKLNWRWAETFVLLRPMGLAGHDSWNAPRLANRGLMRKASDRGLWRLEVAYVQQWTDVN